MGFSVLERAFIWGRFQRFSPLQKLSFSKVDTKFPKDRIWAISSYPVLHLIELQYVKFSSVKF